MKNGSFRGEANVRDALSIMPKLGERVMIDPTAVVMGDVHLGDDVSVWPHAAMRGDVQVIRIGARTNIQDGTVLHVTHDGPYNPGGYPLHIGDDVTIGHRALLHGCTVGNRVLVGMGAPCQDPSSSQVGRKGLRGPQSKFFFVGMQVTERLRELFPLIDPRYFIEQVASAPTRDVQAMSRAIGSRPTEL